MWLTSIGKIRLILAALYSNNGVLYKVLKYIPVTVKVKSITSVKVKDGYEILFETIHGAKYDLEPVQ
jgi:hypothetical protein